MGLNATLELVKKRFGDVVTTGADLRPADAIPTGSLALDIALGIGGIPRGRITEIYGKEATGKTTLCLHIIAEAQKLNGAAVFVDAENAFDPTYARRCGIDLGSLYIVQSRTGEQALEIAEALVRSGDVDVVVIDSVAALLPRTFAESALSDDNHEHRLARLMSEALVRLANALQHSPRTAIIFTNQLRRNHGAVFDSPEITTGGMALRFYASVRLELRRIQAVKLRGEVIGIRTRATVKKNKVAPPSLAAEFDILYGEGISREAEILDLGVQYGFIEKSGGSYSYRHASLGQGRENARIFLKKHPHIRDEIEGLIREAVGLGQNPGPVGARVGLGTQVAFVKSVADACSLAIRR